MSKNIASAGTLMLLALPVAAEAAHHLLHRHKEDPNVIEVREVHHHHYYEKKDEPAEPMTYKEMCAKGLCFMLKHIFENNMRDPTGCGWFITLCYFLGFLALVLAIPVTIYLYCRDALVTVCPCCEFLPECKFLKQLYGLDTPAGGASPPPA